MNGRHVAQGGAADHRPDLHRRIGLAVAVDVDVHRRRRVSVLAATTLPSPRTAKFQARACSSAAIAVRRAGCVEPARDRRLQLPRGRCRLARCAAPLARTKVSATSAPRHLRAAAALARQRPPDRGSSDDLAARRRRRCQEHGEEKRGAHPSEFPESRAEAPVRPRHARAAQLVSAKVSSLPALSALISTQSINCFSSSPVEPVLRYLSACSTAICACG